MANFPITDYILFFSVPFLKSEGRGVISPKKQSFDIVPYHDDFPHSPTHICFCINSRGYSITCADIWQQKRTGNFTFRWKSTNLWFNLIQYSQQGVYLIKPFFTRL